MRIFYASDTTPNSAFKSNIWRNNLYLTLVDLGHDVIEFKYNLKKTFQNLDPDVPKQKVFIEKNRPKVTKELLRQIKAAHLIKPIDLFFSYFYDACVLSDGIDEIRSIGIKTVNWYCNGSYQLHLVREISSYYDWCLVPEKFRLKDYIEIGARPIYCQEAANPNIYKPYNLPKEFDVTFVGSAYGERPYYIKYLIDRGIDIRVWGYEWKKFSSGLFNFHPVSIRLPKYILGEVLSDIEMIKMYSRSKINLGFSTCGETYKTDKRILQVRLRDFEVPMSGGFYMVECNKEIEEFFDIGKEIVCYSTPQDLVDKVKYYLNHDNEREAIRKAGYERCLVEHTWHKRFEMVFKEMKLL